MTYYRWETTPEGVAIVTLDAPGQSANTMDEAFRTAVGELADRLEQERENLRGVVIASAKKTFFAGGDLGFMMRATPDDAAEIASLLNDVKKHLARIESLGIPVASAINGAALGGGLEIALATHFRVALDRPSTKIGLPEVGFGLLPGGGGTTRTVRMFGLKKALLDVLLSGQQYAPSKALALGLIDATVSDPEDLVPAAVAWVLENPDAQQPWEREGYRIPGGAPGDTSLSSLLPALASTVLSQSKGSPSPAARNILAAAVEGAQVDFDNAQLIETRYCTELICGQISANLIKSRFFDMQTIQRGAARPALAPTETTKVTVVGAGMMGAGIAYVAAAAGLEVVLRDVSLEAAERGKSYSAKVLAKRLERGQITEEKRDAILARITPTADLADAAGSDLVVEAVFENPELKKSVFRDIEPLVLPEAVLASNTSTLPITDLATAVSRPEDFIGLHFFSPVDRMPLLEIVVGEKTSDATLAKAFDFAQKIGKTPIVVNDGPGFFTTRVIVRYVLEAVAMVGEGVPPAVVEQAATQAGYPVGPLALVDELTLTLLRDIDDQAAAHRGVSPEQRHPGIHVINRMIEAGRPGRSKGAGFYEYVDGVKAGLSPTLGELFPGQRDYDLPTLSERLLFIESIDAVDCLDQGVLRSITDANVGALLGIGYPAWTGGVFQYINQYEGGPAGFIARAQELAAAEGDRFAPQGSLVARAEAGELYV